MSVTDRVLSLRDAAKILAETSLVVNISSFKLPVHVLGLGGRNICLSQVMGDGTESLIGR